MCVPACVRARVYVCMYACLSLCLCVCIICELVWKCGNAMWRVCRYEYVKGFRGNVGKWHSGCGYGRIYVQRDYLCRCMKICRSVYACVWRNGSEKCDPGHKWKNSPVRVRGTNILVVYSQHVGVAIYVTWPSSAQKKGTSKQMRNDDEKSVKVKIKENQQQWKD